MAYLRDDPHPVSRKLRFGVFEVDPRSGELRKRGVRISLQPRPFQALLLLLQHANEVVTREELQRHLWSADVFVDFEHGLNTAIRKIRLALNDDAEKPRFIETVGRQGYRFLVPVEQERPPEDGQPAQRRTLDAREVTNGFAAPAEAQDAKVALEPPAAAVKNTNRRTLRVWILAASISAAILLIAYLLRPQMPLPRVSRVTQLTKSGAAWYLEPLYTDGPRVYYQAAGPRPIDWQLRQVLLNGNEDTPVGIPTGRFRLRGLSPDDTEFVATVLDSNTVWRIPVVGGSPRRVGNLVAGDIAWSHDGNWFAYALGNQLLLATTDGASSRVLAKVPDPVGGVAYIRWSPDDRRLRFTLVASASQTLWEVGSDGSNLHQIRFDWPGGPMECCGEWTPDGRYYVFESDRDGGANLWALEEKSDWWRRLNRDPLQLTFGPVNYYQPVPSRNSKSIFAIGVQPSGELVRYDAKRKDFALYLGGRSWSYLEFSRNKQWLAYVSYPEGTLWRARSDGTEQLQLTFPPMQVRFPRWSTDDTEIAFDAKQAGGMRKSFVISAQGGNPQPFPEESFSQAIPAWMPDRNAIIYSRAWGSGNTAFYLFDVRSGRSEKVAGTDSLFAPLWSPDGRYLAAKDMASDTLVLVDLKSGARTRLADAAEWGVWSPDSQYIYFLRWGINWILRVHVPDGREEKILQISFRAAPWPFTVAADGSVIILRERGRYDVYALSLSLP